MKLAYVIGPYRAKTVWEITENIFRARRATITALRFGLGAWCPHLNTAHMDGLVEDSFFLRSGLELISRLDPYVDCVIVCGDWEASEGCKAEMELAKQRKLPIFEYQETAPREGLLRCISPGTLNEEMPGEQSAQSKSSSVAPASQPEETTVETIEVGFLRRHCAEVRDLLREQTRLLRMIAGDSDGQ